MKKRHPSTAPAALARDNVLLRSLDALCILQTVLTSVAPPSKTAYSGALVSQTLETGAGLHCNTQGHLIGMPFMARCCGDISVPHSVLQH